MLSQRALFDASHFRAGRTALVTCAQISRTASSLLAALDNVQHPSAIARHAFRRSSCDLYGQVSVPPITCHHCFHCTLGIVSNVERAPHTLPHHPSSLRHLPPAEYQGHAGSPRDSSTTTNRLPQTYAGHCRQDPHSEGACDGRERAGVGGADKVGTEAGEESTQRLLSHRLKAAE